MENKLDDSAFVAVVPSPGERVTITESLNRDLNRDLYVRNEIESE